VQTCALPIFPTGPVARGSAVTASVVGGPAPARSVVGGGDQRFEGELRVFLLDVLQPPLVAEQRQDRPVGAGEDLDAALAAQAIGRGGVGAPRQRVAEVI